MQEKLARLLKNRGGAVLAGIAAAVIAVVLLIVYLHSYRSSVNSGKQPERVLVATKLSKRNLGKGDRRAGGLPGGLDPEGPAARARAHRPVADRGHDAATDILPGQQFTQRTSRPRLRRGLPTRSPVTSGRSRSRSTPSTD